MGQKSKSYIEEVYDPWTKRTVKQEQGCRKCGHKESNYYLDDHLCLLCALGYAERYFNEHPKEQFGRPD